MSVNKGKNGNNGKNVKSRAWKFFAFFSFFPFLPFFPFFPSVVDAKPVGKGGKPGELLTFGVGARAFGMGKAFAAVANDATAPVWNPGGLGVLDRTEITALHTALFADTSMDFLSYAQPSMDAGTFGVSVIYLSSSGFEGRDVNNIVTTPFTNSQYAAGLSYGLRFSEKYAGGLSVKYFGNALENSSSGAVTIALGSLANPIDHFWVGLGVSNLISLEIGDPTADKIPAVIRAGVSYRAMDEQLVVAFDFDSNYGGWYVGGEYRLFKPDLNQQLQIFLRGGANFEEVTMGFGAWYQEYGIDYAFSTQELGGSHRFSMTVRFGESMESARKVKLQALDLALKTEAQSKYRDAQEAYKNGQYEESIKRLNEALEGDAELVEAKMLKEKIGVVSQYFKKSPEDESGQMLRKAVGYWVDGDVNLAVSAFELAVTKAKDPEIVKYKELVRIASEKMGVKTVTINNGRSADPVPNKLHLARDMWMKGKFNEMVPLCHEAIELETTNVEAHLLLGTAYYSMKVRDKAIDAWKKARQYGMQQRGTETGLSEAQLKQLDEHIIQAQNELKGVRP